MQNKSKKSQILRYSFVLASAAIVSQSIKLARFLYLEYISQQSRRQRVGTLWE